MKYSAAYHPITNQPDLYVAVLVHLDLKCATTTTQYSVRKPTGYGRPATYSDITNNYFHYTSIKLSRHATTRCKQRDRYGYLSETPL
ncbi:7733_t:CDS:1, partial [Paraglomus occultum]